MPSEKNHDVPGETQEAGRRLPVRNERLFPAGKSNLQRSQRAARLFSNPLRFSRARSQRSKWQALMKAGAACNNHLAPGFSLFSWHDWRLFELQPLADVPDLY
jgi:hypothetical protein